MVDCSQFSTVSPGIVALSDGLPTDVVRNLDISSFRSVAMGQSNSILLLASPFESQSDGCQEGR